VCGLRPPEPCRRLRGGVDLLLRYGAASAVAAGMLAVVPVSTPDDKPVRVRCGPAVAHRHTTARAGWFG